MPARELDLDPPFAGQRPAAASSGALTISTGRKDATSPPLSANRGSRSHVNTRLAFTSYRRATWLTETPGNRACPQISRFSSADQTRRFFCFVTANR